MNRQTDVNAYHKDCVNNKQLDIIDIKEISILKSVSRENLHCNKSYYKIELLYLLIFGNNFNIYYF